MSNEPDYVTVRPREVRLTHRGEETQKRAFDRSSWWFVAFGAVAVVAVGVLFVFVPGWVPTPTVERSSQPAPDAAAQVTLPSSTEEEDQAPLEKLISDRERARAQDTLARYVELQIRLEDEMQVDAWAKERYAEIEALAATGDELFMQRKYEDAMTGYRDAANGLEALVADGETRFETALEQASVALTNYDLDAARAAIAAASLIHPDDPRLRVPNKRLAELPRLIGLRRAAEEMLRNGDEDGARAQYREALALEPGSESLKQAVADLDARLAERRYQDALSAGYAALDSGQFADARAAFNRALGQRPGDVGAQQGLEQVAQSDTLERIQQLRTGAMQMEADELWKEAAAAYEKVLAIDGTLKFAVDGKQRATERAKLALDIDDVVNHPEHLSSDEAFQKGIELARRASTIESPGPRLTRQLEALNAIIAVASNPVPFTLVSDNATEVTISQVGPLGAFAEKRLELRPGRYLVIGSRDGCRDVRKQIDVAANMPPVDIRCEERL